MKAIQINGYGDNSVVALNEKADRPRVSVGKVLVEVHAAGVNPVDWKIREGYLKGMMPLAFPATLGSDFSGVVVEVGEGVTNVKEGDEVYGMASAMTGGSFAEFTVVDAKSLSPKPTRATHAEAASLPLVGLSAWQALVEQMRLQKEQKILIHGGAGGIGTIAIQLAKHLGAYVVATASQADVDYVKGLGADEVIDYQSEKFEKNIKNCDAVFDTAGGDAYQKSFQVVKEGGIIVSMVEQPNEELMAKYKITAKAQFTQPNADQLVKLASLVDDGVIKPHVDKSFSMEQAKEAFAYQQTGRPQGKVVITIK